jgi:hypothetical protein
MYISCANPNVMLKAASGHGSPRLMQEFPQFEFIRASVY